MISGFERKKILETAHTASLAETGKSTGNCILPEESCAAASQSGHSAKLSIVCSTSQSYGFSSTDDKPAASMSTESISEQSPHIPNETDVGQTIGKPQVGTLLEGRYRLLEKWMELENDKLF